MKIALEVLASCAVVVFVLLGVYLGLLFRSFAHGEHPRYGRLR